jgi:hypothetical protein
MGQQYLKFIGPSLHSKNKQPDRDALEREAGGIKVRQKNQINLPLNKKLKILQ